MPRVAVDDKQANEPAAAAGTKGHAYARGGAEEQHGPDGLK
jgi:hypothetical protein